MAALWLTASAVAMVTREPVGVMPSPTIRWSDEDVSLGSGGDKEGQGCTCSELVASDLSPQQATTVTARMGALDQALAHAQSYTMFFGYRVGLLTVCSKW